MCMHPACACADDPRQATRFPSTNACSAPRRSRSAILAGEGVLRMRTEMSAAPAELHALRAAIAVSGRGHCWPHCSVSAASCRCVCRSASRVAAQVHEALMRFLCAQIEDICIQTGFTTEDVLATLADLQLVKYWRGS